MGHGGHFMPKAKSTDTSISSGTISDSGSKNVSISQLLMQEDPAIKRRKAMAEQLMQTGTSTEPVYSTAEAIGRFGSALFGGYQQGAASRAEKERQQRLGGLIGTAIQQAGKPLPGQEGLSFAERLAGGLQGQPEFMPTALDLSVQGAQAREKAQQEAELYKQKSAAELAKEERAFNRQKALLGYKAGLDKQGNAVAGGIDFGKSMQGLALAQMLRRGEITEQQALQYAASKPVVGPEGEWSLYTPQTFAGVQPGQPIGIPPSPVSGMAGVVPQPGGLTPVRGGRLPADVRKEIVDTQDKISAGESTLQALQDASKLVGQTYSGPTAGARTQIARWTGIGNEKLAKTTEFQTIINEQALSSLKATFGGNPTEGERKVLLDLQASVDKTPEEQATVLDRAMKAAQSRIAKEQNKIQGLQTGEIFRPSAPQQPQTPPPPAGEGQPSQRHIQALLAKPEKAAEFDAKYGQGAAAQILGGYNG